MFLVTWGWRREILGDGEEVYLVVEGAAVLAFLMFDIYPTLRGFFVVLRAWFN